MFIFLCKITVLYDYIILTILLQSPPGSRPGSAQAGAPPHMAASFTKPTTILRVRPPVQVGPCGATNYAAALKSIDAECSVIGSGANHVLLPQFFKSCDTTFKSLHQHQLQYLQDEEEADVSWYVSVVCPTFSCVKIVSLLAN